jgi:hypothetical protein
MCIRPVAVALAMSKKISGINDRVERNRDTMGLTLERVAAAVEQ